MVVDRDACIECGACVAGCPVEAISFVDGKAFIDQEKCISCGACVDTCPAQAIKQ